MRRPAQIKSWLDLEELAMWVREAPTRDSYQKRLAIWLTQVGPFHAHKVADMLQVSKQAVWLWVNQYNRKGPEGLDRKGRGGRRWSYLSWEEETVLLCSLENRALRGEILTVPQVVSELKKAIGKEISSGYVYKLFHRHGWRKLAPRPRHVQADRQSQEEFKKTFR